MKKKDEILKWFSSAKPGDELIYHRGQHVMRLNGRLDDGAATAAQLGATCECFIAQRRSGTDFEYILIKLSSSSSQQLKRYTSS